MLFRVDSRLGSTAGVYSGVLSMPFQRSFVSLELCRELWWYEESTSY